MSLRIGALSSVSAAAGFGEAGIGKALQLCPGKGAAVKRIVGGSAAGGVGFY
jgi:hypothetical protein